VGRAIFTTSAAAGMRAPFWGPYAASKAALEAIAGSYAQEVAYSRLRVHVVDPGIMRTDLRAEAFPGENPQDLLAPEAVAARFVDLAAEEGQEAAA
jgi:NAD(P)-dependent dehydrogenase (short-subunit alcohol dehydrogenase family)